MRCKKQLQPSLFDSYANHECIDELRRVSDLLDQLPRLVDLVAEDLGTGHGRGPTGVSAESALRIAYLIHRQKLSYQQMSFHLSDSASMRAFARLNFNSFPKKSTLQKVVSRITADTWQELARQLVLCAQAKGVESGKKVRIDSTVSQTHIESPTDSLLLLRGIETMLGLLDQWSKHVPLRYRNCRRAAVRCQMTIQYGRGQAKRKKNYQRLLGLTKKTQASLKTMHSKYLPKKDNGRWGRKVEPLMPLIDKVMQQARNRVVLGQSVPVADKVVSLHQPHTDIIRKGGRQTHYGHKINLVTGASAMILDLHIEDGNPADSSCFIPMLKRQLALYGRPPKQIAADGGYTSHANLKQAKELGVDDVVFSKPKGLSIDKMAGSRRIYKQLKKFRSNVEAQVANLKNLFGVGRVNRSGRNAFNAFVMCATFAYNATALAALLRPT